MGCERKYSLLIISGFRATSLRCEGILLENSQQALVIYFESRSPLVSDEALQNIAALFRGINREFESTEISLGLNPASESSYKFIALKLYEGKEAECFRMIFYSPKHR